MYETNFIGVIIDKSVTWELHKKSLSKQFASCTGSLKRKIRFQPENKHKGLLTYYFLTCMSDLEILDSSIRIEKYLLVPLYACDFETLYLILLLFDHF